MNDEQEQQMKEIYYKDSMDSKKTDRWKKYWSNKLRFVLDQSEVAIVYLGATKPSELTATIKITISTTTSSGMWCML